jgi:hypothetical protein
MRQSPSAIGFPSCSVQSIPSTPSGRTKYAVRDDRRGIDSCQNFVTACGVSHSAASFAARTATPALRYAAACAAVSRWWCVSRTASIASTPSCSTAAGGTVASMTTAFLPETIA